MRKVSHTWLKLLWLPDRICKLFFDWGLTLIKYDKMYIISWNFYFPTLEGSINSTKQTIMHFSFHHLICLFTLGPDLVLYAILYLGF